MSQKVTVTPVPVDPAPELAANKRIAIDQLAAGQRVTVAAIAAGVARETVHRWLKDDAVFQAGLNESRAEFRDAAERRLLVVAEKAAENLAQAVESGDIKASLGVLRGLGLLAGKPPAIGSSEPIVLAEELKLLEEEREQSMSLRRLMSAGLGRF